MEVRLSGVRFAGADEILQVRVEVRPESSESSHIANKQAGKITVYYNVHTPQAPVLVTCQPSPCFVSQELGAGSEAESAGS